MKFPREHEPNNSNYKPAESPSTPPENAWSNKISKTLWWRLSDKQRQQRLNDARLKSLK